MDGVWLMLLDSKLFANQAESVMGGQVISDRLYHLFIQYSGDRLRIRCTIKLWIRSTLGLVSITSSINLKHLVFEGLQSFPMRLATRLAMRLTLAISLGRGDW